MGYLSLVPAAADRPDGDAPPPTPPPTTSVRAGSGHDRPQVVIGRRSAIAGSTHHASGRRSPVVCHWYTTASGTVSLAAPVVWNMSGDSFLHELDPKSPAPIDVPTAAFYEKPDTSSKKVGSLPKGSDVRIIGKASPAWFAIELNNRTAFAQVIDIAA